MLAAIVRLMEVTLIRVGNEEYARTNHSYGLTPMRNRHVQVEGATVTFKFQGKSGCVTLSTSPIGGLRKSFNVARTFRVMSCFSMLMGMDSHTISVRRRERISA